MGGSGSVNGKLYTRGYVRDFDSWPKGWQWQDIVPAFEKIEEKLQPHPRPVTGFTQAAIDAAANVGFSHKDGMNDGDLAGVIGHNDINYGGDRRHSSYVKFIHDNKPEKLDIVNHAYTQRVVIENGKAVAVELKVKNKLQRVAVKKEVILSAGALESPKLLMLSGVGPKDELDKFQIPVAVENNAVGENLHDHPNVPIFFKGKKKIDFFYPMLYGFKRINPAYNLPEDQPDTCIAFFSAPITLKQSMYRMAPAIALPRSLYNITFFRRLFRVLINAAFLIPAVNNLIDRLYGIVVILGKPESRGRLRLQSKNVRDDALIDCAYYDNEKDMQTMVDGVLKVQELVNQPAMKAWGASPLGAGGKSKNISTIKNFIEKSTMTTYHFCGTCKMGEGDDTVVDSNLRVKGVEGLRVADASVMPEIPVSAINAPSMMIGYRAADFILKG
jgi:choline dehydrogenase